MNPEIPEIDNCCDKETYAFFGLAAYWGQVLEHSALNLAIVLQLPAVNLVSQELFEELYTTLTRKTFGQLLKASKTVIQVSMDDEEYLGEVLELRNFLIHDYFRENADNFLSEAGRAEMKKALQTIISKFKKADSILEAIYAPLWEKYGINTEFIDEHVKNLYAKAKERDKEF